MAVMGAAEEGRQRGARRLAGVPRRRRFDGALHRTRGRCSSGAVQLDSSYGALCVSCTAAATHAGIHRLGGLLASFVPSVRWNTCAGAGGFNATGCRRGRVSAATW